MQPTANFPAIDKALQVIKVTRGTRSRLCESREEKLSVTDRECSDGASIVSFEHEPVTVSQHVPSSEKPPAVTGMFGGIALKAHQKALQEFEDMNAGSVR